MVKVSKELIEYSENKEDPLLVEIRNHIEHWKKKCGYNVPFDYKGLETIITVWKVRTS